MKAGDETVIGSSGLGLVLAGNSGREMYFIKKRARSLEDIIYLKFDGRRAQSES